MRHMWSTEEVLRLVQGSGITVVDALPIPALGAKDKLYRVNGTNDLFILAADGTEFINLSNPSVVDTPIQIYEQVSAPVNGYFYITEENPWYLFRYDDTYGLVQVNGAAVNTNNPVGSTYFNWLIDSGKFLYDNEDGPDGMLRYGKSNHVQTIDNRAIFKVNALPTDTDNGRYLGKIMLYQDHLFFWNETANSWEQIPMESGANLHFYWQRNQFPAAGEPNHFYIAADESILYGWLQNGPGYDYYPIFKHEDKIHVSSTVDTGLHNSLWYNDNTKVMTFVNQYGDTTTVSLDIGGDPITVLEDFPPIPSYTKFYKLKDVDCLFVYEEGKDEPIDITRNYEFVESLPAIGSSEHFSSRFYIVKGEYDKLWYAYAGQWKSIGGSPEPTIIDVDGQSSMTDHSKLYRVYDYDGIWFWDATAWRWKCLDETKVNAVNGKTGFVQIVEPKKVTLTGDVTGVGTFDNNGQVTITTHGGGGGGSSAPLEPLPESDPWIPNHLYHYDFDYKNIVSTVSDDGDSLVPINGGFRKVFSLPAIGDAENVFYIKTSEPDTLYYKKNMNDWGSIVGGGGGGTPSQPQLWRHKLRFNLSGGTMLPMEIISARPSEISINPTRIWQLYEDSVSVKTKFDATIYVGGEDLEVINYAPTETDDLSVWYVDMDGMPHKSLFTWNSCGYESLTPVIYT